MGMRKGILPYVRPTVRVDWRFVLSELWLLCLLFSHRLLERRGGTEENAPRDQGDFLIPMARFVSCVEMSALGEGAYRFPEQDNLSVYFGHGPGYFDVGRRFPVDGVFYVAGERVEAVPVFRRNGQGVGPPVAQDIAHLILQPIPFVEDEDTRNLVQLHIGKDAVHSRNLAVEFRM